ncbi:MAG: ATP-binding protein, partial [Candidatus Omnitrophota bacterium]
FLLDLKTNQYHLQASRDRGRTKQDLTFDENSPLVLYLKLERRPLVNEEIKQNIEQNYSQQAQELRSEMEKLSASVIIPSFIEDKLIGFLVLGEKLSGKIYTSDDLIVFSVLANQAALAIENAMFFKEAREFQGRIAQAEKMATIGTMANGLSHQINNRLHAISMITGDTYDLLKYIDVASCSDGVKESLEQIKHALERTKENIRLGREIVQGILKYSRPNQEGLEMLSLDTIFDNAINMAQYKVKLDEFDFQRNYSKDLPKIKGNLGQLQEVFFNMIDNAFYAICERKELLKEEGYRGKISVSAELHDKFVRIKVEDNGIGVKDEDFLKLFTPFFTTKASSKGGSGLGLYVIKQIVEQNHKGKIHMESTYREGTTFFIELPIAT